MLSDVVGYMHKEKEKFRALKDLYKYFQVPHEELNIYHDKLKESYEKFNEAQSSSLVHEAMVVKVDMSVTCDLLDSPTSEPSITSTLYSKCYTSLLDDDINSDDSILLRMMCYKESRFCNS
jgi:hypothetical protein